MQPPVTSDARHREAQLIPDTPWHLAENLHVGLGELLAVLVRHVAPALGQLVLLFVWDVSPS